MRLFFIHSGIKKDNFCVYKIKLRAIKIVSVPIPFNKAFRRSFNYIEPKHFNSLPHNIKSSKSVGHFLRVLGGWLLERTDTENLNNKIL